MKTDRSRTTWMILCLAPALLLYLLLVPVPMSSPVLATTAILNFLNNRKEFSFAPVFITEERKKTLPLGLCNFPGAYTADYAGLMAALMIATLPTPVPYLFLQEKIIKGMTTGAVKGRAEDGYPACVSDGAAMLSGAG